MNIKQLAFTLKNFCSCLTMGASLLTAYPLYGSTFIGIGDIAGGIQNSRALGVSANGEIVVGLGTSALGQEPVYWTILTGLQSLGSLNGPAFIGFAIDVTNNGKVVGTTDEFPFQWTQTGGLSVLPSSGDVCCGDAGSISNDGTIIGGRDRNNRSTIWSASTGFTPTALPGLIGPTNADTNVYISGNGMFAGGYSTDGVNGAIPVIWDLTVVTPTIMSIMDFAQFPGIHNTTTVTGLSDDGSVVAGFVEHNAVRYGFRWSNSTGMVVLDGDFQVDSISGDGQVIVGGTKYWSPSTGVVEFQDLLISRGLGPQLAGWDISRVYSVSSDGTTFVGYGFNSLGQAEGWYAIIDGSPSQVPEPSSLLLLLSGIAIFRLSQRLRH